MKKIFKYQLTPSPGTQTTYMPTSAQILHVNMQDGMITFWSIFDDSSNSTYRTFKVYATGEPIFTDKQMYLGTVMDGSYVWHVFEEII